MGKQYNFTQEQLGEIIAAKAKNRNKRIDKRLTVLEMSAKGAKREEIALVTGYNPGYVPKLVSQYRDGGLEAIVGNHYHGNRRNLTIAQEEELLRPFQERAAAGQLVDTREIKEAYEAAVGHKIGNGQIYFVLKRHNWRKVKPRSRHPKKASEEVIEASKKLKQE